MRNIGKIYLVIVAIIAIIIVVSVLQFYVFAPEPWYGMNCEEMIDFAKTPQHLELTKEQHEEFHKAINPCR